MRYRKGRYSSLGWCCCRRSDLSMVSSKPERRWLTSTVVPVRRSTPLLLSLKVIVPPVCALSMTEGRVRRNRQRRRTGYRPSQTQCPARCGNRAGGRRDVLPATRAKAGQQRAITDRLGSGGVDKGAAGQAKSPPCGDAFWGRWIVKLSLAPIASVWFTLLMEIAVAAVAGVLDADR